MKDLFNNVIAWQAATFGTGRPALPPVKHLQQEVRELADALESTPDDRPAILAEFADCFLLLFNACHNFGLSYDDVQVIVQRKLDINKTRKWATPDADGVINHIKE